MNTFLQGILSDIHMILKEHCSIYLISDCQSTNGLSHSNFTSGFFNNFPRRRPVIPTPSPTHTRKWYQQQSNGYATELDNCLFMVLDTGTIHKCNDGIDILKGNKIHFS